MSDTNDFSELISSKIKELEADITAVQQNIQNPGFHRARIHDTLKDAVEQISKLEPGQHISELIGIINQVPGYVAAAWDESSNAQRSLGTQIAVWREVQKEYEALYHKQNSSDHLTAENTQDLVEEAPAAMDSDFLEAVRVGEIVEPSRATSIRRQTGTRPESLRKVRNAKAIIENSPEQK